MDSPKQTKPKQRRGSRTCEERRQAAIDKLQWNEYNQDPRISCPACGWNGAAQCHCTMSDQERAWDDYKARGMHMCFSESDDDEKKAAL
jgi:hypothetical protein